MPLHLILSVLWFLDIIGSSNTIYWLTGYQDLSLFNHFCRKISHLFVLQLMPCWYPSYFLVLFTFTNPRTFRSHSKQPLISVLAFIWVLYLLGSTYCYLSLHLTTSTVRFTQILDNPVNLSAIPSKYYKFANVSSKG